MLSLLTRWRRRRILSRPYPADWDDFLDQNYALYSQLPTPLRTLLRDRLRIFIAEKYWEGVAGFEVTEEMQVTIAAMACTLTLAFDESEACFPQVLTVLVHGEQYSRQSRQRWAGGIVTEGEEWRLGEAWNLGPVALSWPDVVEGGQRLDGFNLAFHEFAHALDMTGGAADGIPPQASEALEREWTATLSQEYETLQHLFAAGRGIPLDAYALTNHAEFFAVATESYLERPRLLRIKLPRLYELLDGFYRLRPAEW